MIPEMIGYFTIGSVIGWCWNYSRAVKEIISLCAVLFIGISLVARPTEYLQQLSGWMDWIYSAFVAGGVVFGEWYHGKIQ